MGGPMTVMLQDETQTIALGQRIAPRLRCGDAVLLYGDLGVGKTTFVRAVLGALGHKGEIPSPTFTLVQSYETPSCDVFHFDLYRLKTPEEIEEIGFDEACADGLVFVEWPEKALRYMPRGALSLAFGMGTAQGIRTLRIEGDDLWRDRLKGLDDANRG